MDRRDGSARGLESTRHRATMRLHHRRASTVEVDHIERTPWLHVTHPRWAVSSTRITSPRPTGGWLFVVAAEPRRTDPWGIATFRASVNSRAWADGSTSRRGSRASSRREGGCPRASTRGRGPTMPAAISHVLTRSGRSGRSPMPRPQSGWWSRGIPDTAWGARSLILVVSNPRSRRRHQRPGGGRGDRGERAHQALRNEARR